MCIAVPCHMFKLWAFIGIMFQVINSSIQYHYTRIQNWSLTGMGIFNRIVLAIQYYITQGLLLDVENIEEKKKFTLECINIMQDMWMKLCCFACSNQIPLVVITSYLQNKFRSSMVCLLFSYLFLCVFLLSHLVSTNFY